MAIVQVSRITHRKGLSENLPQLAGAELGWVIDQRKLYIGNGTVDEGAPAIGNTEILTQYSDILGLASTYTYEGTDAGYTVQTGPTSSDPVTRSLQEKFDDFASVKDFGAKGDGVTDDTDAINRALYQLFCREVNSQVRRSLFFPAGTYLVKNSINIPPYAKLWGDGADSSIIKLDATADSTVGSYVARTADSLQQTGPNIGNNGATAPTNIEIYSMTFETSEVTDGFLVQDASQVLFDSVNFRGPLLQADLTSATDDIACIRFSSSASATTNNVTFNACLFTQMTWAFDVDEKVQGVRVQNSKFSTFYRGIQLGEGTVSDGGPVGFSIVQNLFDSIAFNGIIFGDVENNVSGFNMFLDVGTNFNGGDQTPVSSVIDIQQNNNCSIGDMFERGESNNLTYPRIDINDKKAFVVDKGERYQIGIYTRKAGQAVEVAPNGTDTTITTIPTTETEACTINYTFKQTGQRAAVRHGTFRFVAAEDPGDSTGSLMYDEDYIENQNTSGLTLFAEQTGNVVTFGYNSSSSGGLSGEITYSINHLR